MRAINPIFLLDILLIVLLIQNLRGLTGHQTGCPLAFLIQLVKLLPLLLLLYARTFKLLLSFHQALRLQRRNILLLHILLTTTITLLTFRIPSKTVFHQATALHWHRHSHLPQLKHLRSFLILFLFLILLLLLPNHMLHVARPDGSSEH